MYTCACIYVYVCVCFFQTVKHRKQRPKKIFQSEDSPPGTKVSKSSHKQTGILPCPETNLCPWSPASNQSKKK